MPVNTTYPAFSPRFGATPANSGTSKTLGKRIQAQANKAQEAFVRAREESRRAVEEQEALLRARQVSPGPSSGPPSSGYFPPPPQPPVRANSSSGIVFSAFPGESYPVRSFSMPFPPGGGTVLSPSSPPALPSAQRIFFADREGQMHLKEKSAFFALSKEDQQQVRNQESRKEQFETLWRLTDQRKQQEARNKEAVLLQEREAREQQGRERTLASLPPDERARKEGMMKAMAKSFR